MGEKRANKRDSERERKTGTRNRRKKTHEQKKLRLRNTVVRGIFCC